MYQVGIDIGSSAAKTVVLRDGEIWKTMEMATGFSSRKTADEIYEWLEKEQVAGKAPGTEPPVMDEYLCLMQIK